MWRLERESGGGQLYYFLSGTDYVVGRKNCSILIEDDQSISRSHASFSVSHPLSSLGHPDVIPVLSLKESSKYGTFVNGERMENAISRNLNSGDKITFGVYNSKFRVMYESLVTCSSCLSSSEKSSLNQAMQLLGGHIVNNWTEKSTHLVMTSVKVTIKTICALICCKSIVTPEYFSEMIKAIKEKQALPALTSFIPIIDEPSLQTDSLDFSENGKRKTIFKDKLFLFLTAKQHKKLSQTICFGGGKARLLAGELDDTHLLENPNTCVINVGTSESQLSESQIPTWVTSIMNILESKGLRAIPEAEIGLAVIYMSTEIYCNPQQRAGNRNEKEKSARSNIVGSSFSSSMAVNETVLPVATFNTTAYVADTEPADKTHNWMDISGAREVKETPKSSHSTKSGMCVDRDLKSSSNGDCRTTLFQEVSKPTEKKSQLLLSIEKPASHKEKTSQEMVPSKMPDYFQPTAKKRDREVDEGEQSTAKTSRVETGVSLGSNAAENIFSLPVTDSEMLSLDDVDLDKELNVVPKEKPDLSNTRPKGNNEASTSIVEKDASMKRKQPDNEDDVVEESDLENDEISDQVKQKVPKSHSVLVKRQRLDSEGDSGEDLKPGLPARGNRTTLWIQQAAQQSEQKVKTEPSIKQEPESLYEDKKTVMMTVQPKGENDDNFPSRLLLTEFRTLVVVSRPATYSQYTANAKQGNGPNFKKFRKTAFPGAGSFPHIIGGSDLIAHDKKKNSEIEQWLRQEMEEQTQQAREQSLAEDLFRYNPKNMKKRR
ncbi:PREDICTED: nibrin [Nanorana parkeri]|uniref:nibrin n=1 Tax=Nanorana parkeri TaxID=125878 RepID=UPI000854FD1D|nr:PREDICTED: nibrin [Nanorana parkeri]